MTNVDETSVPESTEPIAHLDHAVLVLEHLVEHGPATRSELASATGLGRGAIAGLTARLIDAGVLRPAENELTGDGRAAPLSLSAADHVLVTALIGADDAIATVASLSGEELARFTVPVDAPETSASALDALGTALARALAQTARSGHPVADVTVLVDGAVAGAPPVVIMDPRFGVDPVDVPGELRARVDALAAVEATLLLPLTLEPAALAAASAEHIEFGIADLLYLAGDTGIMSAAVTRGVPLLGAHGLASSTLAHLPVAEDGIQCECGQRGCLATVASSEQVLERAGLGGFADAHGRVAALEELVTRIEAADDRARWSWLDAARWIGRALQLVTPAVDPAIVVVGGYWGRLIDDIDTAYRANRPTLGGGALVAIPAIAPARVGADAAFHGARRRARDRLVADPLLLAG
ncbi:MAG TPA: ROK family transcriptional regulator [Agromyces sp.]|nr:ROK family transcriptional regulator [Agromyces sp.]